VGRRWRSCRTETSGSVRASRPYRASVRCSRAEGTAAESSTGAEGRRQEENEDDEKAVVEEFDDENEADETADGSAARIVDARRL
jgi:hypothetical protein